MGGRFTCRLKAYLGSPGDPLAGETGQPSNPDRQLAIRFPPTTSREGTCPTRRESAGMRRITRHDLIWKEAVTSFLPQFLMLLFPAIYAEIDWEYPPEFPDKELRSLIRRLGGKRGLSQSSIYSCAVFPANPCPRNGVPRSPSRPRLHRSKVFEGRSVKRRVDNWWGGCFPPAQLGPVLHPEGGPQRMPDVEVLPALPHWAWARLGSNQ